MGIERGSTRSHSAENFALVRDCRPVVRQTGISACICFLCKGDVSNTDYTGSSKKMDGI